MSKILLGITGSIAAYKACELAGMLKKKGHVVKCAMTPDASYFVTPLTMETITGEKVADSLFRLPETRGPVHVSLADEAELVLVAPATADIICKTAAGICDDVLTCAICATAAPVLFAPAMNNGMYSNPILQDKIAYLKSKGHRFVGPVEGALACGRVGMGHLAPLEEIVAEVERTIASLR
ncbi:MAG: flavoprotein [Candidatus Omnitrophica bacterium]|nr:flavoprotein [Candidatus Omnitrophota bacterium]MDD4012777.1 flavoprotein [Candidatus Omnitrophota bacterium]